MPGALALPDWGFLYHGLIENNSATKFRGVRLEQLGTKFWIGIMSVFPFVNVCRYCWSYPVNHCLYTNGPILESEEVIICEEKNSFSLNKKKLKSHKHIRVEPN